MAKHTRVELLTIGDELLLGICTNTHLAYLGQELSQRGLSLACNTVLSDCADEIVPCFKVCWDRADIVIATGGLGPTSDDNTREAIARSLGLELVWDASAKKALEERFRHIDREPGLSDQKQCYKPQGADTLANPLGTAPGIYLEHEGKILIMLPGPKHELEAVFKQEVLPRLSRAGYTPKEMPFIQLRTCGIPEGKMEDRLKPVLAKYEGVGLGFCASGGLVDIRLSAGPKGYSMDELHTISGALRDILRDDFVCMGSLPLAQIVLDQLLAMEKTFSVAESCTGGGLSHAFTNIPGVSQVFMGGAVCYHSDAKVETLAVPECILQQHGAVSEEAAVAMASGAAEHFSSDYALSVTGYAGPTGGTEEDPVGTVYIGYHSPVGAWAKRVVCPGSRVAVKALAVNAALDFMRRKLNKYKLVEFFRMEEIQMGEGI